MSEEETRIVQLITTIPETVVPESCRLRVVEWMVNKFEEIETKRRAEGPFCTCGFRVIDIDEAPGRGLAMDLDPNCPVHHLEEVTDKELPASGIARGAVGTGGEAVD